MSLCSGVSPQGSANTLDRLYREGLVSVVPSDPGSARRYGLKDHPLRKPLQHLFAAERGAFTELVGSPLRPDPSRGGGAPKLAHVLGQLRGTPTLGAHSNHPDERCRVETGLGLSAA